MAKPIVPAVVELYGKTHEMGKPTEVSMAKPIAPSVTELYGKTHDMRNPIGLLWQKPWDKNCNFKCWGGNVIKIVSSCKINYFCRFPTILEDFD